MLLSSIKRCGPSILSKRPTQGLRFLSVMPAVRHFDSYFVLPEDLHKKLDEPSVIPLCVSWFLPNDPQKRTGQQVFAEQRIPGARFMDIDQVKDNNSPYPHMLPSAEDFSAAMSDLGISNSDTVVLYDTKELGIFSAPRGAWMLKTFGHEKVHILNNFKIWVEKGLPTQSGKSESFAKTTYAATTETPDNVVNFEDVEGIAKGQPPQHLVIAGFVDARPHARWAGTAPEPRPGLSSGHAPGSSSLPFTDVLDPETKAFLDKDELIKVFKNKGIELDKPLISSCGTGVTAAVVDAAFFQANGNPSIKQYIYDGSWTEYAQRADPSLIRKT